MTAGECAATVRVSIKACALPLTPANAARLIRCCVAGWGWRKRLVCQLIASSERDARLHAQQGGVTSIGDAPWRAQISLGACPSFAKVEVAIQRSNDARSMGGAPRGNRPRDGNGTLACS